MEVVDHSAVLALEEVRINGHPAVEVVALRHILAAGALRAYTAAKVRVSKEAAAYSMNPRTLSASLMTPLRIIEVTLLSRRLIPFLFENHF